MAERTDEQHNAKMKKKQVAHEKIMANKTREQGLLIEIDGLGPIDEVTERIFAALSSRGLTVAA